MLRGILLWSWKCAKMPVVVLFAIANLTLVALILNEYSINTEPIPVSSIASSEHPGALLNLTVFLNVTPVSPLPPHPGTLPTMPPINSTDPVTNRRVITQIFNQHAYFNVDVRYLNVLAQKALETNAENCDDITAAWAKAETNRTGLPLCSCAPDTLGKFQCIHTLVYHQNAGEEHYGCRSHCLNPHQHNTSKMTHVVLINVCSFYPC